MPYSKIGLDNNKIITALQKEISPNRADLIPPATADNMVSRGQIILNNPELRNEMVSALLNKFFATIFWRNQMKNPLEIFKQGSTRQYGDRVEEYFIDLAKMYDFDPTRPPKDMWKNYPADVKSTFYKTNFNVYIPMTLHENTLRRAFESEQGLSEYTNRVMGAMYNRDYLTEYRNMVELLCYAIANGDMRKFVIPEMNATSAKDLVRMLKDFGTRFTFPSDKYNPARVTNNVDMANQVFFVDASVDALIDVETYAYMFHWDLAEVKQRKIVIDGFNDMFGIWGVLCDQEFFRVWDTYKEMNSSPFNAAGLYWNYFLHHQMILAYSKFANAIVFCSSDHPELPRVATPAVNTFVFGKPVDDLVEDVTYRFNDNTAENIDVIGKALYIPNYPMFKHQLFEYGDRLKQGWFLPFKIDNYNETHVRIEVRAGAFDTETGFSKDENGVPVDFETIKPIEFKGTDSDKGYLVYLGDYIDYEKYNGGTDWNGKEKQIIPNGGGVVKGRPIFVDVYKSKTTTDETTGEVTETEELAYTLTLDTSTMIYDDKRKKPRINLDVDTDETEEETGA